MPQTTFPLRTDSHLCRWFPQAHVYRRSDLVTSVLPGPVVYELLSTLGEGVLIAVHTDTQCQEPQ